MKNFFHFFVVFLVFFPLFIDFDLLFDSIKSFAVTKQVFKAAPMVWVSEQRIWSENKRHHPMIIFLPIFSFWTNFRWKLPFRHAPNIFIHFISLSRDNKNSAAKTQQRQQQPSWTMIEVFVRVHNCSKDDEDVGKNYEAIDERKGQMQWCVWTTIQSRVEMMNSQKQTISLAENDFWLIRSICQMIKNELKEFSVFK